jgi:hypothetical protein
VLPQRSSDDIDNSRRYLGRRRRHSHIVRLPLNLSIVSRSWLQKGVVELDFLKPICCSSFDSLSQEPWSERPAGRDVHCRTSISASKRGLIANALRAGPVRL